MLWLGIHQIFTFHSTYYRWSIIHMHICTVFLRKKKIFFGRGLHFIDLADTSETTSIQGLHFISLCFFLRIRHIDFNVDNQILDIVHLF